MEVLCRGLPKLQSLRLSGNRFTSLDVPFEVERKDGTLGTGFDNIASLELEETLLSWDGLAKVIPLTPLLKTLDLSLNGLSYIPDTINNTPTPKLIPSSLTELKLERNSFSTISSLLPLSLLPNLRKLLLARNQISGIHPPSEEPKSPIVFEELRYLDLSFNSIDNFKFIDAINVHFPNVEGLRIAHNPVYEVPGMGIDEAHMLTVGRLSWKVRLLNFTTITIQDRANAELYYLNRIAKELGEAAENEKERIIKNHPRWGELCKAHGTPLVTRDLEADRQCLGKNLIGKELMAMNYYLSRTYSYLFPRRY